MHYPRGVPTVLQTRATGPRVIAWRMQLGSDAALVLLDTAETPVLMHGLATGLRPGVTLDSLLTLAGTEPGVLRTGPGGEALAMLRPRRAAGQHRWTSRGSQKAASPTNPWRGCPGSPALPPWRATFGCVCPGRGLRKSVTRPATTGARTGTTATAAMPAGAPTGR